MNTLTHSERTIIGLMMAKFRGIKLGRPGIPKREVREIKKLRSLGLSFREMQDITGYSVGALHSHTTKR